MIITDIRVRKVISQNRMKAIASITIDDVFVIHDIKIIESDKGLFIAMPSRKTPNGEFKDIAHPINTETREMIQAMVIEKYNDTEEAQEYQPQQQQTQEVQETQQSEEV
jgi:stage V sporulation protein G